MKQSTLIIVECGKIIFMHQINLTYYDIKSLRSWRCNAKLYYISMERFSGPVYWNYLSQNNHDNNFRAKEFLDLDLV